MKHFLNAVKKIFNALGFNVSVTQRSGVEARRTLAEALDHVSTLGFKPQTVIDVGVARGTPGLYERFPDANHLLIEPLKEFEGGLKELSCKYRAEYILAAASDKPGTITINVHGDLRASSTFTERGVENIIRKVPAVTIDDLCNERNLRGPYLIKADVQGAELKVLDGAKKLLQETELVILEVSLFQFFVNGPQFYDVVSYMKERGFVVYDVYGGHNRPLDGALAQVNIVFVRENGEFRKNHSYASARWRKQHEPQLSGETHARQS